MGCISRGSKSRDDANSLVDYKYKSNRNDIQVSPCPQKAFEYNIFPIYETDYELCINLGKFVNRHDEAGIMPSVYQSTSCPVTKTYAFWENAKNGGPNLTGFSDGMIYFATIKPEFFK